MRLNHNKKGFSAFQFLFAVIGIAFMFIVFYIWVGKNITAQAKNQAESVSAEVEYQLFFSELIHTYGIDLSTKSTADVQKIIERFAEQKISMDQGYSASCSDSGIDRTCTLTITIHETISTLVTVSFFVPFANLVTAPAWLFVKLIGLNELKETGQEAFLPIKPAQAMKFGLVTKVNFA